MWCCLTNASLIQMVWYQAISPDYHNHFLIILVLGNLVNDFFISISKMHQVKYRLSSVPPKEYIAVALSEFFAETKVKTTYRWSKTQISLPPVAEICIIVFYCLGMKMRSFIVLLVVCLTLLMPTVVSGDCSTDVCQCNSNENPTEAAFVDCLCL